MYTNSYYAIKYYHKDLEEWLTLYRYLDYAKAFKKYNQVLTSNKVSYIRYSLVKLLYDNNKLTSQILCEDTSI